MTALVNQPPAPSRSRLSLRGWMFLVLAVAFIAFVIDKPRFLSWSNITQVLLAASVLAIVAAAEGIVVITRQIDLSVGSMVGLVAYVTADTLRSFPAMPGLVMLLLGVLLGAVLGSINASLVLFARVPAIIATLATLAIYRGILYLFSKGGAITADALPPDWLKWAAATILGLPVIVLVAGAVCLGASLWLRYFRSGRLMYAIGSNTRAAHVVGLPVRRGSFLAFVIGGALCGLAGSGWSSLYGTIDSTAATGYELQALAAVVVGGIAVTGGRGHIWGACAGAVFLVVITNVLALLRVDSLWAQAIYGLVILVAVSIDGLTRLLRKDG